MFTHPTVAELARVIGCEADAINPEALSVIPIVPRDGDLPLSFAQQRLWFLDQFEPGSTEYLTPTALRLRGPLNVEALNSALTALVARHESLRTTFESVDGRGVQMVGEPYEVRVPVLDLSGLPEAQREAELGRVLAAESATPFDLREGPLVRPRLMRLAGDEHALTLSMHHIVTDGWSNGVIIDELGVLYGSAMRGQVAVQLFMATSMWSCAGSPWTRPAHCRTSRRPNTARASANSARLLDPHRAAGAVAVAVDDRDADLAAAVRVPLRLAAIGL